MTRASDFEDDAGQTALQPDPLAPLALVRRGARVRWSAGEARGEFRLTERAVVGSAPTVDLCLPDRTVSRLHAELDPRDDGVWVRDLASKNGTYVGPVLVTGARIPDGASLRLGAVELTFAYDRAPSAIDLWPDDHFGPLIGQSPVMRELFARLARLAASDATVLVHGETGTGKELVAEALHAGSPRASGPLVIVDCAALPENLLEDELFGHAKGAFTGAHASRAGALESAAGGTVFLDEIGELPLGVQPKLLRAIEARAVRRLGETAYRKIDVRFVSATHRDLREMVNTGAFREDLYFRLAVLPVEMPPLRARLDDVALLARRFLPPGGSLAPSLLAELRDRPWVGNVRELRNFVERAIALGAREALASIAPPRSVPPQAGDRAGGPSVDLEVPFKELRERWLDRLERGYLEGMFRRHGRNISAIAQAAGLDRTYVHRLVRKHDL